MQPDRTEFYVSFVGPRACATAALPNHGDWFERFKAHWLPCVPPVLTFKITFRPHSVLCLFGIYLERNSDYLCTEL